MFTTNVLSLDISYTMSSDDNIQQNTEQIQSDIQYLQQMENQLLNNLESNTNLTQEEQQQLVEKMGQLASMRVNLYQTLSGVNNYYENALSSSVDSLKGQSSAIRIIESELDNSKKKLELLEEEKNNKMRMVEINNYFGEKYAEHSLLMKNLILMLVPVILLTVLFKKELLPSSIYYVLIVIISVIGSYFFWMRFSSIIRRDNMNYDEYNWFFNPSTAPTTVSVTDSSDPWASVGVGTYGTCVGDGCCAAGLVYDSSLNQCTVAATTTESFVNQVLTKTQQHKYKNDVDMRMPFPFNLR